MSDAWEAKGYYHECNEKGKKRIKISLLTGEAEGWAKKFVNARPELTSAQIRRFYNEIKALEAKIDGKAEEAEEFDINLPFIKMLKSKVAYACPKNSSSKKVPLEFRDFMDECVDGINEQEDFKAFTKVFEAVVGYFYGESRGR